MVSSESTQLLPSPAETLRRLLLDGREKYGRSEMKRLEDTFLRVLGRKAKLVSTHPLQRPGNLVPDLSATPWLEPSVLEGIGILESNWETIRDEVFAARLAGFQRYNDGTPLIGSWNVSYVRYGAAPVEKNRALFPETMRIVNALPRAGEMGLVSALNPGSHIQPHCGPDNLRITAHLGLSIPENCGYRVGEETRRWVEGRCLVFDDSFEHEAWNHSDSTRFVLLVDFWHPDLTEPEVEILREAITYLTTLHSRLEEGKEIEGMHWWS